MPTVRSVTDATFVDQVLLADGLVLVDFWAAWCKPCRAMAPVVEQFAAANRSRITVVKLNVDENRETSETYGITTIPTLRAFRGGREVASIVGALPRKALETRLRGVLGRGAAQGPID
ncbi:thioredoxin [Kineosporia mesophila]|uniref:Thioredoxin n=1 Tax=Kineosporia mesophila TaxID=566012 RepID=A0ABP6ZR51_9ACTN|nr:thioredoxin [Kineosporia mesophila]MCD5354731.1 thioredoxin [Kineosporia mesophila]